MLGPLHVLAVVSNPCRFASRYRLYREFAERLRDTPDVRLYTVELALGERPFEVTEAGNPCHVQVRGQHELWHKENLLNLGLAHLPAGWRYVAWVDADVEFQRKDWAQEALHALQHYAVVQLWESAMDLGPDGQVIQVHTSFCSLRARGHKRGKHDGTRSGGPHWHPGFAWAARREALELVGGFLDVGILGAGDNHMALGLIGEACNEMHPKVHPNYRDAVMAWQELALRHVQGNIGYSPGALLHHWHGKKKDRRYWDRWQILVKHQYDPRRDIRYDTQGVLHLAGNKPELRDDLRRYFRARNEDSVDLD